MRLRYKIRSGLVSDIDSSVRPAAIPTRSTPKEPWASGVEASTTALRVAHG